MSKEQVADKHSYNKSIEDNASQYGYKAANLINLQEIIKEFNDSQAAKSLHRLYGEIEIKVPEFKAISADIIKTHLDEHAPEWRDLFNKFKTSFAAQENNTTLSEATVKKLEELQLVIINAFQAHPLSDESIALFLQENHLSEQQLLMVRSTGTHEDKADMANPGGNESLPCLATSEAISAALGAEWRLLMLGQNLYPRG